MRYSKNKTCSALAYQQAKKIVALTKECMDAEYNKMMATTVDDIVTNGAILDALKRRINFLIEELQKDLECAI